MNAPTMHFFGGRAGARLATQARACPCATQEAETESEIAPELAEYIERLIDSELYKQTNGKMGAPMPATHATRSPLLPTGGTKAHPIGPLLPPGGRQRKEQAGALAPRRGVLGAPDSGQERKQ